MSGLYLWDYGRIDPEMPTRLMTHEVYVHNDDYHLPFVQRLNAGEAFDNESVIRAPNPHWWANKDQTFGDHSDYNIEGDDVSVWHTDNPSWRYVAVWSSNGPTEFRRGRRGEPVRLGTKHLAVFDNQKMSHRTGRFRYDPKTRFFFRYALPLDWKPDPRRLAHL